MDFRKRFLGSEKVLHANGTCVLENSTCIPTPTSGSPASSSASTVLRVMTVNESDHSEPEPWPTTSLVQHIRAFVDAMSKTGDVPWLLIPASHPTNEPARRCARQTWARIERPCNPFVCPGNRAASRAFLAQHQSARGEKAICIDSGGTDL
jgi:hypothetical protein